MRLPLISLLVWLIAVPPASAWNATGHRIIASIAFRQLSAEEQGRVVTILKKHPRYLQDFSEPMPDEIAGSADEQEWLFQQAAVWPDLVRAGKKDEVAFHRSTWHYVNLPIFLTEQARTELTGGLKINKALEPPEAATTDTQEMNVAQVIRFAKRHCADKSESPLTRAVMMAWLMHAAADAHQPLHSTALFSEKLFPKGDRGGNQIPTTTKDNLHSLWDGFPGQRDYRECRNIAITFVNDKDRSAVGKKAAEVLEEKQWLIESHNLAKSAVYPEALLTHIRRVDGQNGKLEPLEPDAEYLKSGGRIAATRVVQAGFRLGAVLKSIVAD